MVTLTFQVRIVGEAVRFPRVVAALLALLILTAAHEAHAVGIEALAQTFAGWAREHRLTGGTFAVTHRGALVATAGFGERRADEPVLLASLSKSITAACVARLTHAGRLRLDASLGDVVPELLARVGDAADPRLPTITVAQLLIHRSGLGAEGQQDPGLGALWQLTPRLDLERITIRQLLERGLRQPLGSAPGERFRYSNTGYWVLGAIVERAAGKRYEDACRELVLTPLGVDHARLDTTWRVLASMGGWRLSGPEYLAFLRVFEPDHPLLGRALKTWMLDPVGKATNGRGDEFYSLGLRVRPGVDGGFVWAHTGSWHVKHRKGRTGPLQASLGTLVTRTDLGVAWFASAEPDPGRAARGALDAALWTIARGLPRKE